MTGLSSSSSFFFFFYFLFCIGVELVNNVVIGSGGQGRDSAMNILIHVSVSLQTPLPSSLPHNIEQSSLCYTVVLVCLFYI